MINRLLKIANYLDQNGFSKEAEELEKIAQEKESRAKAFLENLRAEYSGKSNLDYQHKLIDLKIVLKSAAIKEPGSEVIYNSKNYRGWKQEDFIEASNLVERELKKARIEEIKNQIEKLQTELKALEE